MWLCHKAQDRVGASIFMVSMKINLSSVLFVWEGWLSNSHITFTANVSKESFVAPRGLNDSVFIYSSSVPTSLTVTIKLGIQPNHLDGRTKSTKLFLEK